MKSTKHIRSWVPSAVFAATLALGAGLVDARQFTEKESGRTLEGRVESFNPAQGTVTIRMAGNRTVSFKPEILVDEDVEYIRQWHLKNALASSISLSTVRVNGERGRRSVGNTYEYRTEEAGYRVSVRNTANSGSIEEVPVNWHVVITRSNGTVEVVSGSESIRFLAAGATKEFTTAMVGMETSCKSLSSCPTCVNTAKAFKGDTVEGILIELSNDEGEVMKDLVFPTTRERRIREAMVPKNKSEAKS